MNIKTLLSVRKTKKNYRCPTINSDLGVIDGTDMRMIPKPFSSIPTMVTGFSNQSIEWIAQNGDG